MTAYLSIYRSGELRDRVEAARSLLRNCRVCPRHCGVDRLNGELGKCRTPGEVMVSSYGPHFGEESPLVGRNGSGTIFFTNCNLRCVFCQNYSISQLGEGDKVSKEELACMMLSLQDKGCHNINLVSPTHVVPQILEAFEMAVKSGLQLPLVYNSGGYDSIETLRLLEGIVDIYMPDMKYGDNEPGKKYSRPPIPDYWDRNREAVKEMHRQVGDLKVDERGIAKRGLLIRHLVLPDDIAKSENILKFIAKEISKNSYVNIMSQYYPSGEAFKFPELNRPVSEKEFLKVIQIAKKLGLTRGFIPPF